jgi:ornithine lipid ester-linked acyl 2-hydroxylase
VRSPFGRAAGWLVGSNNERISTLEGERPNPRPLDDITWHHRLAEGFPQIRAEWDRFEASGSTLPLIEDVIQESQGNDGPWRAGLLVVRGRPCEPMASLFPTTVELLSAVTGLRSALWSVLEAGSELPEHRGPNSGVLRYHLGVRCGTDTALCVDGSVHPYCEGHGILFDDTAPHAAWNRGPSRRVTLFCELLRPLPPVPAMANRLVQSALGLDPRYRNAPRRAAEWHAALGRS